MAINFFVALLIGIALSIISYMLMPKPPGPKPPSLSDFKAPTSSAGRPLPLVQGSITVKGLNNMWYGDKSMEEHEADSGKK